MEIDCSFCSPVMETPCQTCPFLTVFYFAFLCSSALILIIIYRGPEVRLCSEASAGASVAQVFSGVCSSLLISIDGPQESSLSLQLYALMFLACSGAFS